jgi:hypothetical protein
MDIRKYFAYNPTIDITAAQIGINKWDWETINSKDEDRAKEIMKQKRYDVLPIKNSDGSFTEYFSTRNWNNYDKLNLDSMNSSNSIYYRFSFIDLIKKFRKENKRYYFLTNYSEILGLVSYVNLNCLVVYNYLYQVIADLEQTFANLLKKYIEKNEIIGVFEKSDDPHLKDILVDFNKSVNQGNDNTIFEHMYLQTVGITLGKFHNKLPEQFRILNKYTKNFSANGAYNELRNVVMHPVRPIEPETIQLIDILLSDYQEIKEILR